VYISNSVMSGDDGFYGIVESVDEPAGSVTIAAGYVMSPAATFATGSILEGVPLVTVDSPADGSGVTRDSGYGAVLMGANSTMTLDFLDINGNSLALPLTNALVVNSLRAIRVTISMTSSKALSDGQAYTATASQVYGLRNLNYAF